MPLPEFILNKILVPKSFKFSRSGFSFALKNNFAPGTISGLKLLADGKEIPGGMITLEGEGQFPISAQMISTSSPVAFPTGILYSVQANYTEKVSTLVLWAETKEAGIIQFTVWKAPASQRKLLKWPVLLKKPVRFVLPSIDKQMISKPVLAGLNFDTFPQKGISQNLKRLPLLILPVKKMDSSIHQKDGVKDQFSTSLQGGSKWNNEVVFSIKWEDILHLCNSKETQAIFAFDPDHSESEDLKIWLRDLDALKTVKQDSGNETGDTVHPESLSTVIIQGNAWQGWELSRNNANLYGKKVNHFHTVMQTEYPWLPVTALGKCLPSEDPADINYRWNQALLQTAGKSIDILYWQLPVFSNWIKSDPGADGALTDLRNQFRHMIHRVGSQLSKFEPDHKMLQAIDLSHFASSLDCQVRNHTIGINHVDVVLLLASLFMVISENADKITFSTLINLSQVARDSVPMTTAWDILSSHSQQACLGTGEKGFESAEDCRMIRSEDGKIEALFSTFSKENLVKLTILNHHSDRRIKIELENDQLVLMRMTELIQIMPKDKILHRTFQQPRKVSSLVIPPRSMLHCTLLHRKDLYT